MWKWIAGFLALSVAMTTKEQRDRDAEEFNAKYNKYLIALNVFLWGGMILIYLFA